MSDIRSCYGARSGHWTDSETRLLIELSEEGYSVREAASLLCRSEHAVHTKAKALGLTFNRAKSWSVHDVVRLKEMVSKGYSSYEIANELERTCSSVEGKAYVLGLSIKLSCGNSMDTLTRQGLPWTDEEDAELRRKFREKCSVEEVAKALGRSPCSVRCRMFRLDVKMRGR